MGSINANGFNVQQLRTYLRYEKKGDEKINFLFIFTTGACLAQSPKWSDEFTKAAMQVLNTTGSGPYTYKDYKDARLALQNIIDSEPSDEIRRREVAIQSELESIEHKLTNHKLGKFPDDCIRDVKQQIRNQSIDLPESCHDKK
jgi:hypothetical protein